MEKEKKKMTPDELRAMRISNLKKWQKGQSGNPGGRPKNKIVPCKELIHKWMSMPVTDNMKRNIIRELEIPEEMVKNMTLQEFYTLNYLMVSILECKKHEQSYYKAKDIFNQMMLLTDNEKLVQKTIDESFDFSQDEKDQLKKIFLNKFKQDSSNEHKSIEEQNEENE